MPEDDEKLSWTALIAERKIREAIAEGVFDNLPGAGKPLDLDEDILAPQHLRIANRVLKNAGVGPEWMTLDREIAEAKNKADQHFAYWKNAASNRSDGEIIRARAEYHKLLKEANHLILKFNMVSPLVHRGPIPLRIKERLAEWDRFTRSEDGT